jgi:gluconolactonase
MEHSAMMVHGTAVWIAVALSLALLPQPAGELRPTKGLIKQIESEFEDLVQSRAKIEVLATGFSWSEGPVWIMDGGYLLFSDVPSNRIYRWTANKGATLFLHPSGGTIKFGFREPGANGLKPAGAGSILLADQGNRAIARLDLKTKGKRFLASRFKGKKFNSPNDLAVGPDGSIWFTDPPYGLEGIDASSLKEQPKNGVYRLMPNSQIDLVESELRFPNGVAFSHDGGTLYVSNSDPARAVILAYHVGADGTLSRRRVFSDMTALAGKGMPGLPDGMTVDERGNLWATGPGGVHIFSPSGLQLGLISTGAAISNCTFGGSDGRTLFMTSGNTLAAIRTKVAGALQRLPRFKR